MEKLALQKEMEDGCGSFSENETEEEDEHEEEIDEQTIGLETTDATTD